MSLASDKRVPNFALSEKYHLMHLIANKYAGIIEDKKTDRASSAQKEKVWKLIENEFNASSSVNTYRSAANFKKWYENRKKELRKSLAEEKKETLLTGGGPPIKMKKHETDEILMSILNKKTLTGLTNKFDDDANDSPINTYILPTKDAVIEYIFEPDGRINKEMNSSLQVSSYLR